MKKDNSIGYKFLKKTVDPKFVGFTEKNDHYVHWALGEWVETDFGRKCPGISPYLCTNQALHYFRTPMMAFLKRLDAGYGEPLSELVFCKVEVSGGIRYHTREIAGCTKMRVVEVIPMPDGEMVREAARNISYFRPRLNSRQKVAFWNAFWTERNRPDLLSARI